MSEATISAVARVIATRRLPLQSEKQLQAALAVELERAGIAFEREVDLGGGDVIDFLCGDVGLELKIKGQRRAIYRQCQRYCCHDRIGALILATSAAMGMPSVLEGKRVHVLSFGRAWL